MKPKLSIIMPVRNEPENILLVLQMIKAFVKINHEIIIVYDFEEDSTIPVVKEVKRKYSNLRLVHNKLGRGIPLALKAGINNAISDCIVIVMADELLPIVAINDMYALYNEGCEIVSVTRYAYGGKRFGGSFMGKLASNAGNRFFRLLSGSVFTDNTTGMKLFKKELFSKLNLSSEGTSWAIMFEMGIRAQKHCRKVGEIPIISVDRLFGGKSSFRFLPWLRQYYKWFSFGVRYLRKTKSMPKLVVKSTLVK